MTSVDQKKFGSIILPMACDGGHTEAVCQLLASGADPNVLNEVKMGYFFPLALTLINRTMKLYFKPLVDGVVR